MTIWLVLNDDSRIEAAFTSEEKLKEALNGQDDWQIEQIETDTDWKLRPCWEVTLNGEQLDKISGPIYLPYRSDEIKYNKGITFMWLTVQAESKEAAQIAVINKYKELTK